MFKLYKAMENIIKVFKEPTKTIDIDLCECRKRTNMYKSGKMLHFRQKFV